MPNLQMPPVINAAPVDAKDKPYRRIGWLEVMDDDVFGGDDYTI